MKLRTICFVVMVALLLVGCNVLMEGTRDIWDDQSGNITHASSPSVTRPSTVTQPSQTVPIVPTSGVTKPTAPSDPSTEPTIPTTEPTAPPTEPTVPPTEPTVPPTEPTVPPTEPTVPPTEPTVPPTEPTVPPTESTVPPTEPTVPPAEPVDPPVIPQNVRYSIEIWVAQPIVELTKQQIDRFNRTNPYGIWFDAIVKGCAEGDVVQYYRKNPDGCADLFVFTQDQTAILKQLGALSALHPYTQNRTIAANVTSSVLSAKVGDILYGYPMTADNGYFMYYDKSVISAENIDSLEDLIAVCERNNRTLSFDVDNAWYLSSFFFATGCVSQWEIDMEGNFTSYYDTFNSPQGLIASQGLLKLLSSDSHRNSSMCADFEYGAAVVMSGIWDYETAKRLLGENLGVADLPSFTVDGKSYHLSSFCGSKMLGVKPQTDPEREVVLHLLAEYLTDEANQLERYDAVGWGPSNIRALQSDALRSVVTLQALMEQNRYAIPQGVIHGAWWEIARTITNSLKWGSDAQKALDNYDSYLKDAVNLDPNAKYAWSVIGGIANSMWTQDFPMVDMGDGIWITESCFYMEAGTEFKVRQGKDWKVNYGAGGILDGNNFVVEETGTYYIVFDANTCLIYLIPA